jgi:hypothetical protein
MYSLHLDTLCSAYICLACLSLYPGCALLPLANNMRSAHWLLSRELFRTSVMISIPSGENGTGGWSYKTMFFLLSIYYYFSMYIYTCHVCCCLSLECSIKTLALEAYIQQHQEQQGEDKFPRFQVERMLIPIDRQACMWTLRELGR